MRGSVGLSVHHTQDGPADKMREDKEGSSQELRASRYISTMSLPQTPDVISS